MNSKTYYDNIKNRLGKPDKYAKVREKIKEIYYGETDETYGYRPMWAALRDKGSKLAMETVRKIMRGIGIKTTLYHKSTAKYSSYKGNVGKKAPKTFDES